MLQACQQDEVLQVQSTDVCQARLLQNKFLAPCLGIGLLVGMPLQFLVSSSVDEAADEAPLCANIGLRDARACGPSARMRHRDGLPCRHSPTSLKESSFIFFLGGELTAGPQLSPNLRTKSPYRFRVWGLGFRVWGLGFGV